MSNTLIKMVAAQKAGKAIGVYSVCSAHHYVLESAVLQALTDRGPACIEATCNQVNQFGGYTQMTPRQFAAQVRGIAARHGLPFDRVVLGGDHIGPNPWRTEKSETAMAKAADLARAYASAGFSKIHLDASMLCADDKPQQNGALDPRTVAERAATLCCAAEDGWKRTGGKAKGPLYVIGTEVPPPGGASEELGPLTPSRVLDVGETIELTKKAFLAQGLESAWDRVFAVVVQPGVEFGDDAVIPYEPAKAVKLSRYIHRRRQFVYEAHSTDYQPTAALQSLVRDHFAILKVGPWLTFALREAFFALEAIERELLGGKRSVRLSDLRNTLDRTMLQYPAHWKSYYHGDARDARFRRMFSYSDRCRYYWPLPALVRSTELLERNLRRSEIPDCLLSQHLPRQHQAVTNAGLRKKSGALIRHKIMEVTSIYAWACGAGNASSVLA